MMSNSIEKPRGRCTPFAIFLNICREKCEENCGGKVVDFNLLSSICWERWERMSEFEKRRFVQMSQHDQIRLDQVMEIYNEAKKICKIVFPDNGQIDWVRDQVPASSTVHRISMPPLSYLKPSQSEDNYGLGTQEEIMRDNEERPLKVVPKWAEEDRVQDQMRRQARIDADKIFALRDCNGSDLSLMFPNNQNIPLETPSPFFKVPKKPKKFRGKENKSKATRRLHYNFS